MDDLLIRKIISDARSRLEKSTLPGSKKKKRTAKELHNFLEEVRGNLHRFNIPVPATAIDMLSDPPKGIAWAVKVAMCNKSTEPEFVEFARKHGQSDVYLAALALSSPESDDHGEIRALQAALELLNESAVSNQQAENAKSPRSPFAVLVLEVLRENKNEETEDLWQRLEGYNNHEFEFNGKQVEISIVFGCENEPFKTTDKDPNNPLDRRTAHWDTGDRHGIQLRRSFDTMISKLRSQYGLSKSIGDNTADAIIVLQWPNVGA